MDILNKILRSSKDPENVSLTVKGVLMNIVGIIILIGASALSFNELSQIVEQISITVGTGALLIGQLGITWGLARKLWNK